jgi:tRNA A64-2'-O-ribosylphosphate transferase
MNTSEKDAPNVVAKILAEEQSSGAVASQIRPTTKLYISSSDNADLTDFEVVISCTPEPLTSSMLKEAGVKHCLHLKCQTGKLGSRDLRTQLPRLLQFFSALPSPPAGNILVCCPSGKDLSVGATLAILCLYMDDEGAFSPSNARDAKDVNKTFIKRRLSWITTSNPALNPSRATLQSVNAVLLDSQDPKAHLQPKSNGTTAILEPLRQELEQESTPNGNSSNPPSAIFTNLITPAAKPWHFTRTLTSNLPTHPSGTVTGTATFTPCTLPSSSPRTLLYAEEGEFVTDNGLKFNARRKYVYQLQKEGEYIAVRFFDDEKMPKSSITDGVGQNGEGVGGPFVEMGDLSTKEGEMRAKSRETHLCGGDLYTASWTFPQAMTQRVEDKGTWWEVRYDVKGLKKDYVSTTRYTRA